MGRAVDRGHSGQFGGLGFLSRVGEPLEGFEQKGLWGEGRERKQGDQLVGRGVRARCPVVR